MIPCPLCEREFGREQDQKRHLVSCRKNPGEDELRHLYVEEGYSLADVGAFIGVSHTTVFGWLQAAGISASEKEFKARRIEIYEDLRRYNPSFRRGDPCARCPWEATCKEIQHTREPLLCEAPDEIQLRLMEMEAS